MPLEMFSAANGTLAHYARRQGRIVIYTKE
jgi:hypothetical protein